MWPNNILESISSFYSRVSTTLLSAQVSTPLLIKYIAAGVLSLTSIYFVYKIWDYADKVKDIKDQILKDPKQAPTLLSNYHGLFQDNHQLSVLRDKWEETWKENKPMELLDLQSAVAQQYPELYKLDKTAKKQRRIFFIHTNDFIHRRGLSKVDTDALIKKTQALATAAAHATAEFIEQYIQRKRPSQQDFTSQENGNIERDFADALLTTVTHTSPPLNDPNHPIYMEQISKPQAFVFSVLSALAAIGILWSTQ